MDVAYKVVLRQPDNTRTSFARGAWRCMYTARKWAEGLDGTPLFIFEEREDAIAYAQEEETHARYRGCIEVWQVQVPEINDAPRYIGLSQANWPSFWHNGGRSRDGLHLLPEGTALADRVKPLCRVWPEGEPL